MTETEEQWKSWIGKKSDVIRGPYEVSTATIGYLCEVVQDANPLYHDEEYAKKSEYGGIIAPPPMFYVAGFPPTWLPSGEKPPIALFATGIPLDCNQAINATVEHEYYEPLRPGDRVHLQMQITEINPRTTRLGAGYFITEEVTYWNQREEKVGVSRNILFRYKGGSK